jgi:HD-GYP domain-containing protein (c-di-GMP phosphodiesterase class II)
VTAVLQKLTDLYENIESLGNLTLLEPEDFEEYGELCLQVLGVTEELVEHPRVDDPEPVARAFCELGKLLQKVGDDLTARDILARAARFAEMNRIPGLASSTYNLAGIACYRLGDHQRALGELERGLHVLANDDHGKVRAAIISTVWANVLYDQHKFEEAEKVYVSVLKDVEAIPAVAFAANSQYERNRFLGILRINLGENRCYWAIEDAACGLPIGHHLDKAEGHLSEALARSISREERMQARMSQALAVMLRGEAERAERVFEQLASQCAAERELMNVLPEIYRHLAQSCALRLDTRAALKHCYRALESSLTVANRMQERRVVETFVSVLEITAGLLFTHDTDVAVKADILCGSGAELVDRLIDFLERKDWYTGHNHSQAVASLSRKIAGALKSIEGEQGQSFRAMIDDKVLDLAGKLHDIGKLSLPWALLNKIIPLTPLERDMIRTHSEEGLRILTRVHLPEIGAIVVEHHECPDGSGYPSGKRDISLMGAIIGVADTFEAMTTVNRKYRSPKSLETAVREIVGLAGRQFDARAARGLGMVFGHKVAFD